MSEVQEIQESFYQPGDWTPEEKAEFGQLADIHRKRGMNSPVVDLSKEYNAAASYTSNIGEAFFPTLGGTEEAVQPMFKHIVNLPILSKMSYPDLLDELPPEEEMGELEKLIEELELHPELTPPLPHGQQEHDLTNLRHYKNFVIVSGTRFYCDLKQFHRVMCIYLLTLKGPVLFISGAAASGADDLIIRWCKKFGYPCLQMPADWDTHGKSAGFQRNWEMNKLATALLSFWDEKSRGTAHMVEIAADKGIPTKVIKIETPSRERWYAMLRKREAQDAMEAEKRLAEHTGEDTSTQPEVEVPMSESLRERIKSYPDAEFFQQRGDQSEDDVLERLHNGENVEGVDVSFSEPIASAAAEEDDDEVPDASLAIQEINEDEE